MAVIKLKGKEIMAKNRKIKPTNQDFVNIINKLIQDIHDLSNEMNALTGAFDLYVEFKDDAPQFQQYIDNKLQELTKKGSDELQKPQQDNPVADTGSTANAR